MQGRRQGSDRLESLAAVLADRERDRPVPLVRRAAVGSRAAAEWHGRGATTRNEATEPLCPALSPA